MRFFKRLSFSILVAFCFFFFALPVQAENEFETSFDLTYEVKANGITSVTQKIKLTNKIPDIYAKEYHFSIGSTRTHNVRAEDGFGPFDPEVEITNNTTEINLVFNQKVVGKGETLEFTLFFDSLDFANKNGQVWEIAIPKMSETLEVKDYQLKLVVPTSFQEPAYMLPQPISSQTSGGKNIYFFSKQAIFDQGVAAAFGQHQIFNFTLQYHLKNPHSEIVQTEIALPPETAFQKIFYEEITPEPRNVTVDEDGNWLATYYLEPNSIVDITARGAVELFIKPRKEFPKVTIKKEDYLKPQKYWEIDAPEIKELAAKLNSPQKIYNFVVESLIYDYGKITQPIGRRGAVEALKNKSSAICTEFTDLFIALARAAGIPAREVNGYAYTTNPALRPLSLAEDILHAWPEYYDESQSLWRPVDPTWGKTTGGVDFFTKLDLNHFVFTFHGFDSTYPYPAGSYKIDEQSEKDIHIEFGSTPKKRLELELENQLPKNVFSGLSLASSLILRNKSNYTLLNETGRVFASSGLAISESSFESQVLPPYGEIEIPLKLKPYNLFKSSEEKITVEFAGLVLEETVRIQPIFLMPLRYFSFPLIIGLLLGFLMIKLAQWLVRKFLH